NIHGIPGSNGVVESIDDATRIIEEIDYPIMLKAAAGGGGKGMRIINSEEVLESGFRLAQAESKAAFGDSRLYIEKFITKPRHIEVQILGDQSGNVIALGERECSIQRRHQKLVEESPSPAVDEQLRENLLTAAIKAAKKIKYQSAGTIEFLMDEKKNYYFMEMNTRIQVEHPVTEMVTGIDIVKEQIKIAQGETLTIKQNNIFLRGHALECRINAEDPNRNFIPTPGTITFFHMPQGVGVRFDTHIFAGYTIPSQYDSLLGKLVCRGNSRTEAIARMKRALEEIVIEGIPTTVPLHVKIMSDKKFNTGNISTHFLEEL
ncbi:MAG: ATP-grasp domain-containing protein, partial [candidate division WOR-3 bacterium]